MLVHDRADGTTSHRRFRNLGDYLSPGDLLVFNQTRVIPARLMGRKSETGGKVEVLLLRREGERRWRALVGGKRVREGTRLELGDANGAHVGATVISEGPRSERTLTFDQPLSPQLDALGEVPLPPYIHAPLDDAERYQTIYARDPGSAAAPTAGLHFTPELLVALRREGVRLAYCTLHIGLDTFQSVQAEEIEDHAIHTERAFLSADDARLINEAKLAGGRVVAVGTTAVRVLESAAIKSAGAAGIANAEACPWRPVVALNEDTSLYITPGYRFRVVDALITNFHLPRSTLLMLVSAFAGIETIRDLYRAAIQEDYRFYSFGDACLFL
jgi:S-adenosylmethionine:tRNA ribosyltransferase-isomerase